MKLHNMQQLKCLLVENITILVKKGIYVDVVSGEPLFQVKINMMQAVVGRVLLSQ